MASRLSKSQIYLVVNDYIGVSGGYLNGFSYSTHKDFYPQYCDLEIDPSTIEGTTRVRFLKVLEDADGKSQARIVRGILKKMPLEHDARVSDLKKFNLAHEMVTWAEELERSDAIVTVSAAFTSEIVNHALDDARTLLDSRGPVSAVDRAHTAFHGYLKSACVQAQLAVPNEPTLVQLIKVLESGHPALAERGTRSQDTKKILKSIAVILDVLNPIRNNASVAHPNEDLLGRAEALLVINEIFTLLQYIEEKLQI